MKELTVRRVYNVPHSNRDGSSSDREESKSEPNNQIHQARDACYESSQQRDAEMDYK